MSQKVLLNAKEVNIILHRLACQLIEKHTDFSNTVLIGLQPRGIYLADRIAKILAERKDIYFTIEGHVCCTQGERDAMDRKTKKRNLSVARAKYVYDYLAKNGVHRSRMKYVGHRRKLPLGGEPELDRRVEILVTRITED